MPLKTQTTKEAEEKAIELLASLVWDAFLLELENKKQTDDGINN